MRSIKVVKEVIDDKEIKELMKLNNLDVDDIENKMIFGLEKRKSIFEEKYSI